MTSSHPGRTSQPLTTAHLIPFVVANGITHLALAVPAVTAHPTLIVLCTLLGWSLAILELLIVLVVGVRQARHRLAPLRGRLLRQGDRLWTSLTAGTPWQHDPFLSLQEVEAFWQRACQVTRDLYLLTPLIAQARLVVTLPEAAATQASLRAEAQALGRFLHQLGFPDTTSLETQHIDLRAVRLRQHDARFLQQ